MKISNKLEELAERSKSKPINLFSLLDKVISFKENIEVNYSCSQVDECIVVVKTPIDEFSSIEDFILRARIAEELDFFKNLKEKQIFNLANSDYLTENDKAIVLKKIIKYEIEESFIKNVLKEININIDDIQSIYWIEDDSMDSSLIFNTNEYLYCIERALG